MTPPKVLMVDGGQLTPESIRRIEELFEAAGNDRREILVLEAHKPGDESNAAPWIMLDMLDPLFKPEG